MSFDLRDCTYYDLDFILSLKELGMKWYIEKIYGWDIDIQREKTRKELDKHIDDIKIIQVNNEDIGVTTFYKEDNAYVVGLIIIHPKYQCRGIASTIISNYINIAKAEKCNIIIKCYKDNPAKDLYKRLGFRVVSEDNSHIHMII